MSAKKRARVEPTDAGPAAAAGPAEVVEPSAPSVEAVAPSVVSSSSAEAAAAAVARVDASAVAAPAAASRKRARDEEDGVAEAAQARGVDGEGENEAVHEIRLNRVDRYMKHGKVAGMLREAGVPFQRVQKRSGQHHGFVAFHSLEEKKKAMAMLQENELFRFVDKPAYVRRRRRKKNSKKPAKAGEESVAEPVEVLTPEEEILKRVVPLHALPYEEQLKLKSRTILRILRRMRKRACRENPHAKFELHSGGVCRLEDIVPSPSTDGYRNKSDFTVGQVFADATQLPTAPVNADDTSGDFAAGFALGGYVSGNLNVVRPPPRAKNTSRVHVDLAAITSDFMRQSGRGPYLRDVNTGFWRRVVVRHSDRTKQAVVLVEVNPTGVSDEELSALFRALTQHLVDKVVNSSEWLEGHNGVRFVGLVTQQYTGTSTPTPEEQNRQVLFGTGRFIEVVLGLQFSVSSSAFFQVNTECAELLYQRAIEWAGCSKDTVLFDVCCGTGTIGLCLARHVRRVVGLEIVESAIDDARSNARRNGIDNAVYYAGRAENTIKTALQENVESADDEVVAILDPPRGGLHPSILKMLRNTPQIQRIVYVSCNPESLLENCTGLFKAPTKAFRNKPFVPKRAVPVDMFPGTEHVEMILLLEREQ